ncbi:13599_t:CDS:1, partial [Racocetra persica]
QLRFSVVRKHVSMSRNISRIGNSFQRIFIQMNDYSKLKRKLRLVAVI